jgi:cytochrome c oxidase assembly protein subunit 15
MGDSFIPPALYSGGWISSFEQVTTIHFNHRMLAYFTGITLVVLALRTWLADSDVRLRRAGVLLLGAITLQIVLGISTVLSRVDVAIAAGHQSGAVVLLTTVLFWVHCKRTIDQGDVVKR